MTRNKISGIGLFFILISSLSSCEISKTIDLELPPFKPTYVMIGLIGDSTVHNLYFGKTIPPFSENHDSIGFTNISLYRNGQQLGTLERINETIYKPSNEISINENGNDFFEFKAVVNTGTIVSNKPVNRPNKVFIERVSITHEYVNSSNRTLTIYINDPKEENYYALRIDRISDGEVIPLNTDNFEVFSPYEIFDDVAFNGSTGSVIRKISISENSFDKVTFKVTLFSISKETYQFFWSVGLNGGSVNDFYNTTIEVSSNIINGNGCIGAYRSHTIIVQEN